MKPRSSSGPGERRPRRGSGWWALKVLVLLVLGSLGGATDWYWESPSEEVIGFLLGHLRPRTRLLYDREWWEFLRITGLRPRWERCSPEVRDACVAHYLVKGYNRKDDEDSNDRLSKTEAGYLVSVLRYRDAGRPYPLTHRVAALWRHREPPASAWPLTAKMVQSLAGGMKMAGSLDGAVLSILAFTGLLRIGEGLGARWRDLYIPERGRGGGSLYLPHTKRGPHQFVPLEDPATLEILRRFKARKKPRSLDEKVFDLAYFQFRLLFLKVIAFLSLPIGLWRTHSLRRGGATALLQATRNADYVAIVGRWKSLQSARTYLRMGEALTARLLASMTLQANARMTALCMSIDQLFEY